jgi:hypothetical protein
VIAAVRSGKPARVAEIGPPLAVIGSLSRAMICAPPGREFLAGDYGSIEARLTGETNPALTPEQCFARVMEDRDNVQLASDAVGRG